METMETRENPKGAKTKMAKTFPVKLEVEEIALGTVLRKLHEMPGVVRLDLNFGEGGKGAGKEKLQQAAAALNTPPEEAILKALANGPMKRRDIIAATGMKEHRIHYAINKLGLKRNAANEYILAPLALPAPTSAISHGPAGRATPGSGNVLLIGVLKLEGAMPTGRLRTFLGNNGMSPKSISGVLARARRDGLIKKTGDGYVLTAAGNKNGAAHG